MKLSSVSLENRLGVREVPEVSRGEHLQKQNLWKSGGRRNRCRNRPSCGVASVDPHGNHASAEARMAVWCCFIPVCALWVALREYDFGKGLFF